MPDHKITNSFCDSDFKIEFERSMPLNGIIPFAYKWSNGVETLDNLSIDNPGDYRLTVTDANGCSKVASFNVEEERRIPRIVELKIDKVLCEQGFTLIDVVYFLPSLPSPINSVIYESGFKIQYDDPSDQTGPYVKEFEIVESGFSKTEIVEVPLNTEGELKVTPFTRTKGIVPLECYGESESIDIPTIEQPEQYFDTWINIRKVDPSNCEPIGEFVLEGYCSSPNGCTITGEPTMIDTFVQPLEEFAIPLPLVAGVRKYMISPILDDNLKCRVNNFFGTNLRVVSVANNDFNLISLTKSYWKEAAKCNCYIFDIENNFTSPVSIIKSDFPVNDATVTQVGDFSAQVCIENDGPVCVSVIDRFDCEQEFCNEYLEIRKIETSLTTTFDPSIQENSGDFIAKVSDKNALPVSWDVGDLSNSISNVNGASIHLSQLEKGAYKITVTDATDCSDVISFNIDKCHLFDFVNGLQTSESVIQEVEGPLPVGERFISVVPTFTSFNTNRFRDVDIKLVKDAIRNLSTFEWTGPNGFSSNEKFITPVETGTYCVRIITACGEPYEKCHKFIANKN